MTRKRMLIILGVLILVMTGELFAYYKWGRFQKEEVPAAVDRNVVAQTALNGEDTPAAAPDEMNEAEKDGDIVKDDDATAEFPASLNLKAVFYAQAPYGDWSMPWQEACEEASVLLIANEYFGHTWSREQFKDEILRLVEWEKQTFGAYEHTSVDQTAQILEEYLGLETVIHENPSFEDVQRVLSRGNFIVMTFAGRHLGNPNYRNGGPVYHAMLVKGYKEGRKIITHDVGTRNGEDYVYSWEVIEGALRDYAEPIESGAKRMIEVLPPQAAGGKDEDGLPAVDSKRQR